jgi:hypothetical protein
MFRRAAAIYWIALALMADRYKILNDYPPVVPSVGIPTDLSFSQILHRFMHRFYTDRDYICVKSALLKSV